MKSSLRWAAILSLLPAVASAQEGPADALPPPPPPAEGAALACPSCEPGADDRRAVDEAVDLLAAGRADAARRVLQPRLTGQSPWGQAYSPLAVLDRLATRMATRPATADAGPEAPRPDAQQPRGSVEAVSLYASAITFGLGTGAWLDVMFDVDDVRAAVALPLVMGGLGAGALFLAERVSGPIRRGRGAAMSNGFALGVSGGVLLGVYGGAELRWRARGVASTMWAGAALGAGLGYGLGALAESSPASASFVGSGGLWGAVLGLTAAGLIDADADDVPIAGMVGEVIGAGAAAALTGVLHPAESQVRWMDLGVFSGGLAGLGLAVLLFADSSGRSLTGPALVIEAGMIGGGVLGYVLGRPDPAPRGTVASRDRLAVSPSIAPTAGGAQVLLSLPNLL